MKASIFCLVYNHENYLRQALDGFLMQKTNFDFEIVVGEDCSTDTSRSILLDYKQRYPTKFKLLLHEHNIGMVQNVILTLENCTGEYVAMCEGDDYWTDPNKLQKQVDFLEKNRDFSICYHKVEIFNEANQLTSDERFNLSDTELEYDILDLAKGNLMHTPSVVFRNKLFTLAQNEKFKQSPASDYFIHMLNAKFGKIKYFPNKMSVYRVNSINAVWSSLDSEVLYFKWVKVLQTLLGEFDDNATIKTLLEEQQFNSFKAFASNYKGGKETKEIKEVLCQVLKNKTFFKHWSEYYLSNQVLLLKQHEDNLMSTRFLTKSLLRLFKQKTVTRSWNFLNRVYRRIK